MRIKSELIVTVLGLLGAVVTEVLGSGLVSEGSRGYLLLSLAAMVSSYIGGRSWVKKSEANYQAEEQKAIRTKLNIEEIFRRSSSKP